MMPRTANRQRYLNLTTPQARHLSQHRELLVVLPCDPQPDKSCWIGLSNDEPPQWWIWYGPSDESAEPVSPIPPPLGQPGDVVLCREQIFYNPEHDNYYFESDRKGCGTMAYVKMSGFTSNPIPFSKVPEEAIRLRPTIERVECREASSISVKEAESAGFESTVIPNTAGGVNVETAAYKFRQDWSRRYRRRGERFGFEVAWGFFYWLKVTA